jgi:hypothetical protein
MPQLEPVPWVPPTDPTLWPPDPTLTGDQIADYVANSLISSKSMCVSLNNNKIVNYYNKMNANNASLEAGRSAPYDSVMPAPDLPIMAGSAWSYAPNPDVPLCAAIPLSPDLTHENDPPPPNQIMIGLPVHGAPGWWTALKGDSVPSGETVPGVSQDGIFGMWLKYGAAVGTGWYRKVG